MNIQSLEHISVDEIVNCFSKSFNDYFVPMPKETHYYIERWRIAKVDFSHSVGAFEGNELVGFILQAVDYRSGELIAYNAGTGVIPAHRGKRLVKQMYEYSIPLLKNAGVKSCLLEVIVENKIAIKSYESIGFEIIRKINCYKGAFTISDEWEISIREVGLSEINKSVSLYNVEYSWENQMEALQRSEYSLFEIIFQGKTESFFIIDKLTGYLAQWNALTKEVEAWKRLFSGIQQLKNTLKINNVDDRISDKISILDHIGIPHVIDQYEMRLEL